MVLIVDSGSTKSDWVLLKNSTEKVLFKTMGFNPYFHNETIIANAIKQNEDLFQHAAQIDQVFYYGAGASSDHLKDIVKRALKRVFTKAQVVVDHDLVASAYATYTGVPSISCILGTGSNSCHFDGANLTEEVPALAYILGDEGSGSYFGKKLLSSFLYKHLPKVIHEDLVERFGLTKDLIMENVYMMPHANVYLASFMRFIAEHKDHPWVDDMVYEGLKEFIKIHVLCYSDAKEVPVHFIGSVGYFFREQLERAATDMGITLGIVTRKPIDGLVKYHLDHMELILND
jgi:N-acetylglucosamine kinase-like BadF-type ATPase